MPVKAKPRYDPNRNQWTLYYKGKRRYLCAGAANEAKAWTLADQITEASTNDGFGIPKTVAQATAAWLGQRGNKWHKWRLAPFLRFGAGTALDDVHSEYLDDYMLHQQKVGYVRKHSKKRPDYTPATLRDQIRCARAVLTWAHVRGYLQRPIPRLPRLPRIESKDRSISTEDMNRVFSHLPDRAKSILTFQLLTGCRPGEACLLKHDEIQGDVCELHRGKTFARTGQPRLIHLSDAAKKLIAEQPTTDGYVFLNRFHRPYKPSGLRSILRRAGEAAGVKVSGTYQLRHSWAQAAYDTGLIGLAELGAMLGHEHGSTATLVYAKMRRKRITDAAKCLAEPIVLDPLPKVRDPKESWKTPCRKTDQRNQRKTAKAPGSRRIG